MDTPEETNLHTIEDLPPALQHAYRSLIAEMTRSASEAGNLVAFCQVVVDTIQRAFDYYSVNLYILDPDSKKAVLKAATRENMKVAIEHGHALATDGTQFSLIGRVVRSASPCISGEDREQPEILFPSAEFPPVHAELCFPIVSRTKDVLGVLDIQSVKYCSDFGMQDFIFYMAVADHLASLLAEQM
jgi:signal transduction protein with GAF and PtsI domain